MGGVKRDFCRIKILKLCFLWLSGAASGLFELIPSFQWQHYSQCEWAKGGVQTCSDPEKAFHNWMERDIRFAAQVRHQAEQLKLRALVVDGTKSFEENTALAQNHFGFG